MKKILIVNNNMHIGGVQIALNSLLWSIQDLYDVTLLLFAPVGDCMKDIPPKVQVITANSAYRYLGMTKHDTVTMRDKLGRLLYGAITRLCGRKYAVSLMGLTQKKLEEFDAAISYLHNAADTMFYGGCNDFVLRHVDAKKKITFLHCDYVRSGANTLENAKQYSQFDIIAACSQGCADSFLSANPDLKDRVCVVPNCHRFDRIRAAAHAAPVQMSDDKINLVTVARLGKEKGVERALRVIAGLGQLREKIHYYIIGDGIQKTLMLQIIEEEGLSDCVTMCGIQSNPFGYIQAADLMLIPSYSEAAPLVIGEAACLGTPILSMETSSAREMIEQTGYGWVCDNSEEAMLAALRELLMRPEDLKQKRKELSILEINNKDAIAMFDFVVAKKIK